MKDPKEKPESPRPIEPPKGQGGTVKGRIVKHCDIQTETMTLRVYEEPHMTAQGKIAAIAWLENAEGEGMGLRAEHLEKMLSEYFKENF